MVNDYMLRIRSHESGLGKTPLTIALVAAGLLVGSCKSTTPTPDVTSKPVSCPSPDRFFMDGKEVPITGTTADGLKLTMMTPADGINRNEHIQWNGATLRADRDLFRGLIHNSVVVKQENGKSQSFGVDDVDKDGVLELTTVSGGPAVELPTDLSSALMSGLEESLPTVCLPTQRPSPTAPATLV